MRHTFGTNHIEENQSAIGNACAGIKVSIYLTYTLGTSIRRGGSAVLDCRGDVPDDDGTVFISNLYCTLFESYRYSRLHPSFTYLLVSRNHIYNLVEKVGAH